MKSFFICGRKCIVKERFIKTYRHKLLDKKLSYRRLIQEVRCNMKCHKINKGYGT